MNHRDNSPVWSSSSSEEEDDVYTSLKKYYLSYIDFCDVYKKNVQGELGRGAEGTAYLVNSGEQNCVAKIGLPEHDEDYLLDEADMLVELDGAGGAPKLLALCKERRAGILMSFCGSQTFRSFVAERPPLNACLFVLCLIGKGLEEIHKKDILHNDVKADNIIVETVGDGPEDFVIHFIDFGSAAKFGSEVYEELRENEEKPINLAPEVVEGECLCTEASDIYSFGLVILNTIMGYDQVPSALKDLEKNMERENPGDRPQLKEVNTLLRKIYLDYEEELTEVVGVESAPMTEDLGVESTPTTEVVGVKSAQ
ncbi:serine/threonine-protein kinase shk2-like [Homarus americanus]|uniref:serine/threonine-protein kinase shk2-like n=1 Tax=Homarus americanus TaxID=6706 RepID=UPI001C47ADC7|nr:serine/threonine-protein kinase shk2-like [Homarus americanus]